MPNYLLFFIPSALRSEVADWPDHTDLAKPIQDALEPKPQSGPESFPRMSHAGKEIRRRAEAGEEVEGGRIWGLGHQGT